LIVVSSFYKFRPFKIKVNKEALTLDSLIISNIGRMAKFLTFEESRPNDGRFEVSMVENTSKFVLFGRIIRAVFKGLPPSFTTTKYSFTTLKPIPMQIDGEVSELKKGSKVTVTIVPEALETYA